MTGESGWYGSSKALPITSKRRFALASQNPKPKTSAPLASFLRHRPNPASLTPEVCFRSGKGVELRWIDCQLARSDSDAVSGRKGPRTPLSGSTAKTYEDHFAAVLVLAHADPVS